MSWNSEIYRRGIVLPLTHEAALLVRHNQANKDTSVRIVSLSDDKLFYGLWTSGLIPQVNQICDSLIDEHEEEELNTDQIVKMLAIAETYRTDGNLARQQAELVEQIKILLAEAITLKASVFFIF